jgi:hypothetical protein
MIWYLLVLPILAFPLLIYIFARERERERREGTLVPLKFSNLFVMEILYLLRYIPYVQIEENYVRNNVKGVTAYFSGSACG